MKNISIIIPFGGKVEYARQVIDSLTPNIDDKDEIILVNDAGGNPEQFFPNIKIYDLTNVDHSKNNLVCARNFGAHMSKNNYLIFIDEDCIPMPCLVDSYRDNFENGYKVICGRIEWADKSGGIIQDYRVIGKILIAENGLPIIPIQMNTLANEGQGGGGNFAIEKKLFNRVDKFDYKYNSYWGHEEIDLYRKVIEVGENIYYNIKAKTTHMYHPRNMKGLEHNTKLFRGKWSGEVK